MKEEKNTTEYEQSSSRREEKAAQRDLKYEQALDNFSQKELPQAKKKKHKWLSPVVTALAIGIGVFFIIKMSAQLGDEQKSFAEVFGSVKTQNVLYAVAVLLAIILLDMAKFVISLQATTGRVHLLIGAKTSLLGRYYDAITPFASGGQPVQIYYLHKKGFSGGLSSAVVLIKYFFNTWAWVLVALVSMVCNTSVLHSVPNGTLIAVVGWLGWALNMSLPLFILFFVIMPKFATKLTNFVINIGFKMRIVKDKEKAMTKALTLVKDFRSSFAIMAKRPLQLILLVVVCIAETSLTFAFPYFVIKMFNGFTAADDGFSTMFAVMALNAYAFFGASIVPTPGSSGAIEVIITAAFSQIAGSTLMWVVFTWRFAVFYIYIIIGVLITIFTAIRNFVRARKNAANQSVEADVSAEPTQPDEQQQTSVDPPENKK